MRRYPSRENDSSSVSFAKLPFHRRLSCNRPSTTTMIKWFLSRLLRLSLYSRRKRFGDRQRIHRVAGQKLQPRKKRNEARRDWSSKGFFNGWLLKMLEERKGKNLTWWVFREIGATLVGLNQINLRNLNFDKKKYTIFCWIWGISCGNTVIFCLLCKIKYERL